MMSHLLRTVPSLRVPALTGHVEKTNEEALRELFRSNRRKTMDWLQTINEDLVKMKEAPASIPPVSVPANELGIDIQKEPKALESSVKDVPISGQSEVPEAEIVGATEANKTTAANDIAAVTEEADTTEVDFRGINETFAESAG